MTPDPKARFVGSVLATIARHALLARLSPRRDERETVVVGVSGGPDSVALLRVLHELAEKKLAVALVVAHLNHGLRSKTADEDQAFVESLARELKLPCEAARADISGEAEAAGIGIEEAGRMARRRFFVEVARSRGARKVALAHHADDRAETVLFNILRGTGIEGLASLGPRAMLACEAAAPAEKLRGGLDETLRGGQDETLRGGSPDLPRAVGPETHRADVAVSLRGGSPHPPRGTPLDPKPDGLEIVRPLIETPRDLALGYLAAISQDYRQDETNLADYHTRNRVRNMLLPLLAKEFNPRVDEALVRLSEQASAAAEVLADALDEVWGKIVRETPTEKKGAAPISSLSEMGAVPFFDACGQSTEKGTVPFSQPREKGTAPFSAVVIDADDFVVLRPWMQGAVIRRAVERLGGGLKHMSAERTREIARALLSKTVVGPIDLPGGLAAERNRRAIRIMQRT